VLLLEAGGSDETDAITNPNRWPMTLGTELHWGFVAEPNPRLNGRAIPYSMGKVLGGGSSINVSTWSRGHQADWDFYAAQSGDASWSYEAVLELYRRRIEAWAGDADPDYRGSGGPVHVQPAAEPHAFSLALLEGAESAGLRRFPNANGSMMEASEGCAFVDETVREGKRESIFRSYLYARMSRLPPNGAAPLRLIRSIGRLRRAAWDGQNHLITGACRCAPIRLLPLTCREWFASA
jgi:choline dehydrogenase